MNRIVKARVCAFLALVIVLGMCMVVSAEGDIQVVLDGRILTFDQTPVIVNGRTLVPLRAIFEGMGADITWDDATKTVTATLDNTTVKLTVNENIIFKNGETITLDVPAQIINSRTMVPARAVSESFGASVRWNEDYRWVVISTDTVLNDAINAIETADNYVCRGNVPFTYDGVSGTISSSVGCDFKNSIMLFANDVAIAQEQSTGVVVYNRELAYTYESGVGLNCGVINGEVQLVSLLDTNTAFKYNTEIDENIIYTAVANDGTTDNFAIMINKKSKLPTAFILSRFVLSEYFDIDAQFEEDYTAEIVLNSSTIIDIWNSFKEEYENAQQ